MGWKGSKEDVILFSDIEAPVSVKAVRITIVCMCCFGICMNSYLATFVLKIRKKVATGQKQFLLEYALLIVSHIIVQTWNLILMTKTFTWFSCDGNARFHLLANSISATLQFQLYVRRAEAVAFYMPSWFKRILLMQRIGMWIMLPIGSINLQLFEGRLSFKEQLCTAYFPQFLTMLVTTIYSLVALNLLCFFLYPVIQYRRKIHEVVATPQIHVNESAKALSRMAKRNLKLSTISITFNLVEAVTFYVFYPSSVELSEQYKRYSFHFIAISDTLVSGIVIAQMYKHVYLRIAAKNNRMRINSSRDMGLRAVSPKLDQHVQRRLSQNNSSTR